MKPTKSWDHITVASRRVTLVANFSVIGARHNLTCLVFGDDLDGHSCSYDPALCHVSRWRESARFDASSFHERDGGTELSLRIPELDLEADLFMRPITSRSQLHNLAIGDSGVLHWSVRPRLLATGSIRCRNQVHELSNAPSYRDRNWGTFEFGQVAWDWGYVLPDDAASPFTVVFARMFDATRTRVLDQHVLVWEHADLLGSYRGAEIEFIECEALSLAAPSWPAALALVRPSVADQLPRKLAITAASGRGTLTLELENSRAARLLVPRDTRRGVTVIHESLGRASVRGHIDGQSVVASGHSFHEVVHA